MGQCWLLPYQLQQVGSAFLPSPLHPPHTPPKVAPRAVPVAPSALVILLGHVLPRAVGADQDIHCSFFWMVRPATLPGTETVSKETSLTMLTLIPHGHAAWVRGEGVRGLILMLMRERENVLGCNNGSRVGASITGLLLQRRN